MDPITIGVDEVGRGCLAGPVVAAAVILPEEQHDWIAEIKDSKKLSAKKRVYLANLIAEYSVWSIRETGPHHIDEMNILKATLWTMAKAVNSVYAQSASSKKPVLALIDGNHTIPIGQPRVGWLDVPVRQEAVKNGDNVFKCIGAASIIAKVYRDNYMVATDILYPEYGFVRHKGYGTEEHREAIMVNGPCPIHRRTFRGVREYVKS